MIATILTGICTVLLLFFLRYQLSMRREIRRLNRSLRAEMKLTRDTVNDHLLGGRNRARVRSISGE